MSQIFAHFFILRFHKCVCWSWYVGMKNDRICSKHANQSMDIKFDSIPKKYSWKRIQTEEYLCTSLFIADIKKLHDNTVGICVAPNTRQILHFYSYFLFHIHFYWICITNAAEKFRFYSYEIKWVVIWI